MKRKSLESKTEVQERVDGSERDLDEQVEVVTEKVDELDTVRDGVAELNEIGTAEGFETLQENMEGTEDAAVEEYEEQDGQLDELKSENKEIESDLTETLEGTEDNRDKVENIDSGVKSERTRDGIEKAKKSLVEEIEFLVDEIIDAVKSRETSEKDQESLRGRVHSGRKGAYRE